MNVGNWTWSRTIHVVIYFNCLPQICTKLNSFEFDFSQKFLERGSPSPSPNPPPVFFSGCTLSLGFALNSQALRTIEPGFNLDSWALHALNSSFALHVRLKNLVWLPQNEFLDPLLWRIMNNWDYCVRLLWHFTVYVFVEWQTESNSYVDEAVCYPKIYFIKEKTLFSIRKYHFYQVKSLKKTIENYYYYYYRFFTCSQSKSPRAR